MCTTTYLESNPLVAGRSGRDVVSRDFAFALQDRCDVVDSLFVESFVVYKHRVSSLSVERKTRKFPDSLLYGVKHE